MTCKILRVTIEDAAQDPRTRGRKVLEVHLNPRDGAVDPHGYATYISDEYGQFIYKAVLQMLDNKL